MRKWWILLLSMVLLFTFSSASFAKSKEKTQKANGVITAVDSQASTITIQTKQSTVQLTIDSSSKLKISEFKSPTIADVWVGDNANATYVQKDTTNLLKEVVISKKKGSVKGEVEAIDVAGLSLTVGGKQIVVSDKTVIRMKKEKLTLADLVTGDQIEAKGFMKEGILQANQIEVKRTLASVKGKVESIESDKNQLVVAGTTITVATSTKIHLMDTEVTLADVMVNDKVVVVGTKKADIFEAKIIKVNRQLEELEGKITALDATNQTITLEDKEVTVNEQTKLAQEDEAITFAELQVGNEVEAKGYVNGDKWIALKIKLKSADDNEDDGDNNNEDGKNNDDDGDNNDDDGGIQ